MARLKKYFRNWRSIYFYSNRCVRNTTIRYWLYLLVRNFVPKPASLPQPKKDELAQLEKDGLVVWECLIDDKTVATIHDYLLTKPVYDLVAADFDGKPRTPLNLQELTITRQTKLKYFDSDIVNCREIIELANSPQILSLVSAYFGCKPTISLMSAWWTKAGGGAPEVFYDDSFHRDVADYRFVKLFVYLNDVGPENGAHSFVRGSHLSSKCTERRIFSDEEIERNFGKDNQLILTGKSGCGFLENTWGLHRSIPSVSGERLVLHIMYNLAAFDAGSPEKPLAKNIYNVDSYSNRVYLSN